MKFIFLISVLLFAGSAHCAKFTIYATVTPPFTVKKGDGIEGLAGIYGKAVSDKIIKSGKASKFEVVWVPWKRALAETSKAPNGLFFPMGRNAEREKGYIWLGHLGTLHSWFYASNPKVKIDSLNDLKKYRIGFLNGSMREIELRKVLGPNAANLEGITDDLVNFKKLLNGRIDIWVTQTEVFDKAFSDYKDKNKKPVSVEPIKKFIDHEIWIVGSLAMDNQMQKELRDIFGEF